MFHALTEAGTALLTPIRALGAWAAVHGDDVPAAQDCFHRRQRVPDGPADDDPSDTF